LCSWQLVGANEERLLLHQFLRFSETRVIAQHLIVQLALQLLSRSPSLIRPPALPPPTLASFLTALHHSHSLPFTSRYWTHDVSSTGHGSDNVQPLTRAREQRAGIEMTTARDVAIMSHSAAVSDNSSSTSQLRGHCVEDITPRPLTVHHHQQQQQHTGHQHVPAPTPRAHSDPAVRRPWQSTPGYGGTLVSPTTGKKRVLCAACRKTFCDKGALKIHYSAVH